MAAATNTAMSTTSTPGRDSQTSRATMASRSNALRLQRRCNPKSDSANTAKTPIYSSRAASIRASTKSTKNAQNKPTHSATSRATAICINAESPTARHSVVTPTTKSSSSTRQRQKSPSKTTSSGKCSPDSTPLPMAKRSGLSPTTNRRSCYTPTSTTPTRASRTTDSPRSPST